MGGGVGPAHEVNIYDNKTIILPVDLYQNDNIQYTINTILLILNGYRQLLAGDKADRL